MPVTAKLRELKIAPRKVRLVAGLIRRKGVKEAQGLLRFTVKKGCLPILKLLNSAISNAKNNHQLSENDLYVAKVFVDEGRKQRKFRARARGTASFIKKRSSHVTIILDTVNKSEKTKKDGSAALATVKADRVESGKIRKIKSKVAIKNSRPSKKGLTGAKNSAKIFRRKAF